VPHLVPLQSRHALAEAQPARALLLRQRPGFGAVLGGRMQAMAQRTARGTALEAALAVVAPAFEALENGILIIDRGRTLFANAAMSGLVGVSAEVILAMPPASFGRHLASL